MTSSRSTQPDATRVGHLDVVHLSRTQREVWEALVDNEMVDSERMSRRTIDALVHAGLAYEKDSGFLCVTTRGRAAYRVIGNAVAYPKESP